jgi:hypothetical protein
MQCPVCSRPAQNLTPATLEGVVIGCENCGSYRISGVAYHELMRLELERRGAALETARRVSLHGWPMIDSSCVRVR